MNRSQVFSGRTSISVVLFAFCYVLFGCSSKIEDPSHTSHSEFQGEHDIGADHSTHTHQENGVENGVVERVHSHKTTKSGASVRFSENYDGVIEPGLREEIEIVLSSPYQAGTIAVEVGVTEGMDLLSTDKIVFELPATELSVPVTVYTDQPGRYSLSLFAQWSGGGGVLPTVSSKSIALQVGKVDSIDGTSNPKTITGATHPSIKTDSASGIIIYSAEETIR